MAEHREERVRARRVSDVPDEQGHGLVVLDAPLREELGRDRCREDVVTFALAMEAASPQRKPDWCGKENVERELRPGA